MPNPLEARATNQRPRGVSFHAGRPVNAQGPASHTMDAKDRLTNQIAVLLVEFLVHGKAGCISEVFRPIRQQRSQFEEVPTYANDVVVNQP